MESASQSYREVISGLVEDRICPIFGQVMDFLGLRDADEKFLEPLKSTEGSRLSSSSSFRNNNTLDNCSQSSNSFDGSSSLGGTRSRLTPLHGTSDSSEPRLHSPGKGLNGQSTPSRSPLGSGVNCNGSTSIESTSEVGMRRDPSLGNGCHVNKGGCQAKSSPRNDDECVSNGRHLLDFSIFSFNNSESRHGPKGIRSESSVPQNMAQPTETSDLVNSSSSQLMQYTSDHPVTSDDPETTGPGEKLGRLQFSIAYDFQESTLTLRIIRAIDLVAKDFSGTSDPYVKIMLLPDKKRKLTTNVKRKNLNPRWNEVFAFEGFSYNKLLTRTLYLQVLDYDRFSRDDPIGEICIPMTDIDLARGQTLWKNLQISKGQAGRLGEVNIGLCYQPTTGQLTVVVHEARQLKAKDINGLSDPYVKIWLLFDGKKVEKKKTATKEKCLNPVFEESFVFTVPYEKIRQTSISVSVMDYDRMGRNEQIGQVVLGAKSGSMEVKHWNEMFAKTRQEATQWHILKDIG